MLQIQQQQQHINAEMLCTAATVSLYVTTQMCATVTGETATPQLQH